MANLQLVVFIACYLLQVVSTELAIARNNPGGFSFGNFYLHEGFKLLKGKTLRQIQVKTFDQCLGECIGTMRCLSINVNKTRGSQGLLSCEILASTKYQDNVNLTAVSGADHYSMATPCHNNPCKHHGKCVPMFSNNSYTCECLAGTLGKECEIQDFRSCAQLYTAGYKDSGVYYIKSIDNANFEVYCNHDNGGGWTMVFKSVMGVSAPQHPSKLWTSNSVMESSPPALSTRQHYKNRIVDQWQAFKPTRVRVSLYTNKAEVVHLVFNATESTKTNWFSRQRVITSPWTDLHSQPVNSFSIYGDIRPNILARSFLINSYYAGCPNDFGWMMLLEMVIACSYEKNKMIYSVLYAPSSKRVNWTTPDDISVADMMVIYVR